MVLLLNLLDHSVLLTIAAFHQGTRLVQVSDALGTGGYRRCFQLDSKERGAFEAPDLFLPLDNHGQRWGHHPANRERRAIKQRIEAGGVHANQPIRLCAAECGLIKMVVCAQVLHEADAALDRAFLHGRNPKPANGLLASGFFVDQPEDQLAFPSGIRGADDIRHIGCVHQRTEFLELLLGFWVHGVLPFLRNRASEYEIGV